MPQSQSAVSGSVRPLTILVVEDESFVRMIAIDTIEDAGHVAVEAADASQALDVLDQRNDIDVVFTDIKMPGPLDGLALAAEVRKRSPATPIILTSGHLYRGDFDLPGSTAFLQKPYPASMLLAELDRLRHH